MRTTTATLIASTAAAVYFILYVFTSEPWLTAVHIVGLVLVELSVWWLWWIGDRQKD